MTMPIERSMQLFDHAYRKLEFLYNKTVDHFTMEDAPLVTVSAILDYLHHDIPVVYDGEKFSVEHRNEYSHRLSLDEAFEECERLLSELESTFAAPNANQQ